MKNAPRATVNTLAERSRWPLVEPASLARAANMGAGDGMPSVGRARAGMSGPYHARSDRVTALQTQARREGDGVSALRARVGFVSVPLSWRRWISSSLTIARLKDAPRAFEVPICVRWGR